MDWTFRTCDDAAIAFYRANGFVGFSPNWPSQET
jgi:hypothetical protein